MPHQEDLSIENITVVGPDDHPTMPVNIPVTVGMFKSDAQCLDSFFHRSPERDLAHSFSGHHDGDSSGGNVVPQPLSPTHNQCDDPSGYSTPITPYSVPQFQELHPLDTQSLTVTDNGFDLSGSQLQGSFSPSNLSPSFGGLSLSDAAADAHMFDRNINSKDMSQFGLSTALGVHDSNDFNDPSRSSLSLMISASSGDSTAYPKDIFPFDDTSLFQEDSSNNPLSFDPNSLNNFLSADVLSSSDTSLQRPTRAHHHGHNRGLSVAGTSWTPSPSPSITSPSLSFAPSEYPSSASLSSGGLLPPTPFHPSDDFSILGDGAAVRRRHSHTGSGTHSRSASRGRSPDLHSASSSRRSSPYPSPHNSLSPSDTLSPNQVWQQNDHLAVPMASPTDGMGMGLGGASIPRRHSFNGGTYNHGHSAMHRPHAVLPHSSPNVLSSDEHPSQHAPSASSSSSSLNLSASANASLRKIASNAGIKASQARRTKEARFKCDMCAQTFTTNHNLKNHVNVHLGLKEHRCGSCGREFTTQSVLARHLKTCKVAISQGQA